MFSCQKKILYFIFLILSLSFVACAGNTVNKYYFSAQNITGDGSQTFKKQLKEQSPQKISGHLTLNYQITENFENVYEKQLGELENKIIKDEFTQVEYEVKKPKITYTETKYVVYTVTGEASLNWELLNNNKETKNGVSKINTEKAFGGFINKNKTLSPEKQKEKAEEILIALLIEELQTEIGSEIIFSDFENFPSYQFYVKNNKDLEHLKSVSLNILSENPQYGPANYNLGLYYEYNKDYVQALNYYKTAFKYTSNAKYRKAVNRLTTLLRKQNKLPEAKV